MNTRHLLSTTSVGVICALVGGTAGIAESSASTHRTKHATTIAVGWSDLVGPSAGRNLGVGAFGAIHSVMVEPSGTGRFDTVTVDAGAITAVSSGSITLKEGSSRATYATPTITPAGAVTVTLDGRTSTFSALKAGDRVLIAQSSAGISRVNAIDSSGSQAGWDPSGTGWSSDGPGAGWGPGGSSNNWGGDRPGGGAW